jgi:hypothetical protein
VLCSYVVRQKIKLFISVYPNSSVVNIQKRSFYRRSSSFICGFIPSATICSIRVICVPFNVSFSPAKPFMLRRYLQRRLRDRAGIFQPRAAVVPPFPWATNMSPLQGDFVHFSNPKLCVTLKAQLLCVCALCGSKKNFLNENP